MSTRSHLSIVTKNMGSKDPNTSNKRMISTKTRSGRASPNGIEARLSSSSSSSDSDTPKTPDHDCDDIEQETHDSDEPASRDRTPRAPTREVRPILTTTTSTTLFKATSEEPSISSSTTNNNNDDTTTNISSSSSSSSSAVVLSSPTPTPPSTTTSLKPFLLPSPPPPNTLQTKKNTINTITTTEKIQKRRTSNRKPSSIGSLDYNELSKGPQHASASNTHTTLTGLHHHHNLSSSSSSSKVSRSTKPLLGIKGVSQVQDWIATWIESDPSTAEQLQLHFLERARTQAHLKLARASIEHEMDTLKKVIRQVYDDQIDLEDDVLMQDAIATTTNATLQTAVQRTPPVTMATEIPEKRKRGRKPKKKNVQPVSSTKNNPFDPSLPQRKANARLLVSLTDNSTHLERPAVPICGGGCKSELGFCEKTEGENYPEGEYICDLCEGSYTGCRWTCVDNEKGYDNCEYDLCCNCAGNITQTDVERWERRVNLLANLAQQPKRWWLDPRSDPSIVAINSSKRMKANLDARNINLNVSASAFQPVVPHLNSNLSSSFHSNDKNKSNTGRGKGWRKGKGKLQNRKRSRDETEEKPSYTTSTSPANTLRIDTIRQHKRNRLNKITTENGLPASVVIPGGTNMMRTIVGRAIEVQWGRNNEWYPGYVTDFMDQQHCIKYNNGEVEWVTLYEHFDNGTIWQLLPQNMRIKPVECFQNVVDANGQHSQIPSKSLEPGNNWRNTNRNWRKYHGVKFEHGMYHAVLTLPSVVKPTAAAIAAIVENHSSASVIQKKKELLTTTKTSLGFYDTALEAGVAYDRGLRIHWGAMLDDKMYPCNFQPWERPLSLNYGNALYPNKNLIISNSRIGVNHSQNTIGLESSNEKGTSTMKSLNVVATSPVPSGKVSTVGFRPATSSPSPVMMKGRSRHRLCSSPQLDIVSPKNHNGNDAFWTDEL